jgi:hypothetical protein
MVLGIWHLDRFFVHLAKYHFFPNALGPPSLIVFGTLCISDL